MVDAHVHVWDPARLRYPWLHGIPALDRAFLPADIDRAGGASRRHVFVQAGCVPEQAIDEVRWVLGMRDAWPELAAIVADADLRSGRALESQLDALASLDSLDSLDSVDSLADRDTEGYSVRVVGIRHLLQDEPDELLEDARARSALLDGLRMLAERGLTFDACVRHRQLAVVAELLESVPDVRVVLDHLGKPPVDDGIDSAGGRAWARNIERMALLPLAHVKLSGLGAEASTRDALGAHAAPFLVHTLNAFGAERSMIGSDWPVSSYTGAGGTTNEWRERVRGAASDAGLTADDLAALESRTAERFYGLPRS
ncbi:amidohydrolase family protein [Humibacter sp.]|jgi:L-fuconolactonase|uniref:amidohydrolase family protein n=1 Tax=Humibacter sp. TaxID=1940291 RepID=UPI002D011D6B|nr:amidohydrolase family protein [Humibacter sp.]HVX09396.1 amidohydrolase family protein [Humibacter sp.]